MHHMTHTQYTFFIIKCIQRKQLPAFYPNINLSEFHVDIPIVDNAPGMLEESFKNIVTAYRVLCIEHGTYILCTHIYYGYCIFTYSK